MDADQGGDEAGNEPITIACNVHGCKVVCQGVAEVRDIIVEEVGDVVGGAKRRHEREGQPSGRIDYVSVTYRSCEPDHAWWTCPPPACWLCVVINQYESHYSSAHSFTCHECRRSFPNERLMDRHITERHDPFFSVLSERQPMYVSRQEGRAVSW